MWRADHVVTMETGSTYIRDNIYIDRQQDNVVLLLTTTLLLLFILVILSALLGRPNLLNVDQCLMLKSHIIIIKPQFDQDSFLFKLFTFYIRDWEIFTTTKTGWVYNVWSTLGTLSTWERAICINALYQMKTNKYTYDKVNYLLNFNDL